MNHSRATQISCESCTNEHYQSSFQERHLLHGVVDYWSREMPENTAMINAARGTQVTWRQFQNDSRSLAKKLLRLGFGKGDFLATSLPFSPDHIVLEYACFRIGVIHVPLDLRLSEAERDRSLKLVKAKGYVTALKAPAPAVEHVWDAAGLRALIEEKDDDRAVEWPSISVNDGAMVIFTTGSTGQPKAALLTHRGITAQNYCLGSAFDFSGARVLANLPASHIGGQAELLMTTFFWGATAVVLEAFDPGKSLEAIEIHQVTIVGQIPAMFHLEWRHSDYAKRNLSSLKTVIYGGQAVPRPFLEKLRTMGPTMASGLGLTEASGFCTYTELTDDVETIAAGLGFDRAVYPMTIREPMNSDGSAGAQLVDGQVGHVCFRGPQTFAGYVNDAQATAKTISTDGFLYTGDMGFMDARGLHFSGRARWMIKPAGYQVFPGDVEAHFCSLTEKVALCSVVGVEHPLWMEAIVAFVEKVPGVELSVAELRKHARGLTSYMRPLHYVILEPGQTPLNRVAKVDMLRLKAMADEEISALKKRGRWR